MKIKYRHSASKTNTFIDSPAFWIINELYDFDSGPNARMVMGLAAEDAANHALQNQITDENTITEFAQKKYLEHDGINGDEDECDDTKRRIKTNILIASFLYILNSSIFLSETIL